MYKTMTRTSFGERHLVNAAGKNTQQKEKTLERETRVVDVLKTSEFCLPRYIFLKSRHIINRTLLLSISQPRYIIEKQSTCTK